MKHVGVDKLHGSRDRITKIWPMNLKQDLDCSLTLITQHYIK